MKKKAPQKVKEPVRIRFKELADGNKSIYLDYYIDGNRKYDFLKLYLVPTTIEGSKETNNNSLRLANAIKAQKIVELQNNAHGFKVSSGRTKIKLVEYVKHIAETKGNNHNFIALAKHLEKYKVTAILRDVDKSFCTGCLP